MYNVTCACPDAPRRASSRSTRRSVARSREAQAPHADATCTRDRRTSEGRTDMSGRVARGRGGPRVLLGCWQRARARQRPHSPSARSHRRPSAGRVIGCPDFGEKSRVHAFRFSITPPRRCACGRRGAGAIWMLDSSTVQQCPRLAPTSHDRRSHTCTHASDDATQSQTRSHTHSPSPCPWYRCTLPRPLPLDPLPRAIALPLCLCVDTRPVPSQPCGGVALTPPSLKDILCHLR